MRKCEKTTLKTCRKREKKRITTKEVAISERKETIWPYGSLL